MYAQSAPQPNAPTTSRPLAAAGSQEGSAPFWADVEAHTPGATAPWAGWLTRRQLALMVVAGVVEFAITLGLLAMAAHSSARLEQATQATAPAPASLALRAGPGLSVPVPAVQALRPARAS